MRTVGCLCFISWKDLNLVTESLYWMYLRRVFFLVDLILISSLRFGRTSTLYCSIVVFVGVGLCRQVGGGIRRLLN